MIKSKYIVGILLCMLGAGMQAARWTTHFAYNNVTRIAMTPDKVFALSDGNLFSVDKQTEQIHIYNRQSGLHGTGISCIAYDEAGKQLIIGYETGKIDILSSRGVHYIGELYDKDMTQRRDIYNVTIQGRTAYLSTHFGIQTLNLNALQLVDSYWLRPGGEETPVADVLFANDSIYAFTDDSLFCAAMSDNIVDYHFWKRELRSSRIAPDPNKGIQYDDGQCVWYAGHGEGIVRMVHSTSQWMTYKPEGPALNNPYRIRCAKDRVGMVPGGYDAIFYNRPGLIMYRHDNHWTNYNTDYISAHTGLPFSTDYCDIAFDPADPSHFFVASFGYGLFEFQKDTLYHHYTKTNSALESILPEELYPYVWVDGLRFDAEGNLWMLNVSNNGIKILKKDGSWISLSNTACQNLDRSKDLLFSVKDSKYKIISSQDKGIGVMNDNGTIDDESDDKAVLCNTFIDESGNSFTMGRLNCMHQTRSGILLFGTKDGLYRIDEPEEMLNGYRLCSMVHLDIPEEALYDIFTNHVVSSIADDDLSQVWVGTKTAGLFCLSSDLSTVLYHYSMNNSPISNAILSLQWNSDNQSLYIGTAEGLVSYEPNGPSEGWTNSQNQEEELILGSMQQWRLHLSYDDASRIEASPSRIYAVASGSLFSYNRADGNLEYLNRSNGLNGMTVANIAYDKANSELIIVYDDGRIDLMQDNGDIHHMPDLYMKAGVMAVTPNDIFIGSRNTYLAMPFGIVALNTRKKEVKGTYYIGEESSDVNVTHLIEQGDSLYAFAEGKIYSAALNDNLDDYHYWHSVPCTLNPRYVGLYRDRMYALGHDSVLYVRNGKNWQSVHTEKFDWMHIHDNRLLVCIENMKLYELTEDHQLSGLCDRYELNDAIYTQSEYWLGVSNGGLIRLGSSGDDIYSTEGPNSNFSYQMVSAHDKIYSVVGGRWALSYLRRARMNTYDGLTWTGINAGNLGDKLHKLFIDPVSTAVDPQDPGHYFVATYGTGVIEFRDNAPYTYYSTHNSTLREAIADIDPTLYTFTDGAMMDGQGNLWVMNATAVGQPLHILQPNGQWTGLDLYSNGTPLTFSTPTGIWVDRRNKQRKWMLDQRATQGLILLDDGGTPTNTSDDRCRKRSSFTDQNGNVLTPSFFRCWAQDKSDRIWIGTEAGILLIPAKVDFFASDACQRIIIPRNDGSGLGDYLLGNEMINCMAVDGGNRMWIGTANSGLYVIEDDTITVAHFTENNSLLPSDAIQSIAIMPKTGEVFVGTEKGIASYRSDASEPQESMGGAYAFPNPVRPNYVGYITITGLTENTTVNIIDEGGNLVCKTKSNGGTAVWDGNLADGRRATPGVYTALCNSTGGHTTVKILVIR